MPIKGNTNRLGTGKQYRLVYWTTKGFPLTFTRIYNESERHEIMKTRIYNRCNGELVFVEIKA